MKISKKLIILLLSVILFIVFIVVALKFIFIDDIMERVYIKLDTHADFMIISREGSQKCLLISDKNEISNFLKLHKWRDSHLPCCLGGMDSEYTVKIVNGDVITSTIYFNDYWRTYSDSSTPYNREFYNELQKYISRFNESNNSSYQYTFQVRNSTDFYALKEQIYNNGNGNIAYLPAGSITATKPSITLSYAAVANSESEWNNAFRNNHQLGKFSPDNYFIPFIDDLKERGLYFDNSEISFSSGNGLNFSRRIAIYLTRSLTENEITEIKNKSSETYIVGNPQGFHPVTNFIYKENQEYKIKVIFDKEQSHNDLMEFCRKHNVDSFDYDKELLTFDNMTIYFFRNTIRPDNLNPSKYRSLTLSKDLTLTVREHEPTDFVPFKDEDPPFSIIEQIKISEDDYQMIRRIISNYDFLDISDRLGFGDYEFDRFCFIGIQIDGEFYVCGGQDPYSNNERFHNIRTKLFEILNVDINMN